MYSSRLLSTTRHRADLPRWTLSLVHVALSASHSLGRLAERLRRCVGALARSCTRVHGPRPPPSPSTPFISPSTPTLSLARPTPSSAQMAPRVFIAAIGGATCSGKTTTAKHLARIIPSSLLLLQDDFAPPAEKVPVDPRYGWQDWDDAEGAIEWDRQRETIRELREKGELPESYVSHDHLNEQVPVPISEEVTEKWRSRFEELLQHDEEKPTIVIAEGFLMLVDPESVRNFDLRFFIREDYATLKKRRYERHGYDKCVWPAYLKAHRPLFVNGDVESGAIDSSAIEGVELFEAKELSMDEMVDRAAARIYGAVKSGQTKERWTKPRQLCQSLCSPSSTAVHRLGQRRRDCGNRLILDSSLLSLAFAAEEHAYSSNGPPTMAPAPLLLLTSPLDLAPTAPGSTVLAAVAASSADREALDAPGKMQRVRRREKRASLPVEAWSAAGEGVLAIRGLETASSGRLVKRASLAPTDTQKVTLGVIAAYAVVITVLWNLPVVRWVLWPWKMLTIAFHEFGHAATGCCTGAKVKSIELDPREGGVTMMAGGVGWITLPAGYLGSSLIGAVLIFCGFNVVASKIASLVVGVCFLITLWWSRRDWLSILTILVATGLIVAFWFIAHGEALRYYMLWLGTMSGLYSIYDICDDLIFRKVNESDASVFARRYGGSPVCWGVIWGIVSLLFMAIGIIAGLAAFKSAGDGTKFLPTRL
ncbi:Nicotinamide riboside kinase [Rhodotorula toruloides]|nr:Nicotinamide riboside kinase [Rhodotorula toruloides]